MSVQSRRTFPKVGWWKKFKTLGRFASRIVRYQKALRDAFENDPCLSFSWTHHLVVDSDDSRNPFYFCGEACFVECLRIWGAYQRLAFFWTGEKIASRLHYRFVPSGFHLLPMVDALGSVLQTEARKAGLLTVDWLPRHPNDWLPRLSQKDELFVGCCAKDGFIMVQCCTEEASHKFNKRLVRAGLVTETLDERAHILITTVNNMLRGDS